MDRLIISVLLAGLWTLFSMNTVSGDATASAPGIVLSSGAEGDGYWNAGARLQSVADDMDFAVENLPSAGSLENLDKLLDADSPVNLAFAQADAAQHYLNRHQKALSKLDLLENIGQECVFIVTGIDSDIRTDEDLQAATNLRLGIASPASGIAVTFAYMVSQIPEMADIKVSYGDTLAVMDQLNARNASVDAVMMVHRPRDQSAEVEYALANANRYRFVELSDERFTQEMWNGRKIYSTMNLALPGSDTPLKTVCVQGLLLANKHKLSIDQRNKLTDLVSYHWMQVYATQ
ncbi:MAG TPA: hypothetical protein VIV27_03250 [Halioglobus sp.]